MKQLKTPRDLLDPETVQGDVSPKFDRSQAAEIKAYYGGNGHTIKGGIDANMPPPSNLCISANSFPSP